MSFLEWRRFNFFDLKKNVDSGSIQKALGGTNVTATSSGHGTLVICDSEGVIHLINRNFQITTFQGYLINVSLAEQMRTLPLLVTIGEEEIGINPLIKVWDLEKQDRHGNPICLRTTCATANNKSACATALCVADACNMMAVGFSNGSIILYRGNINQTKNMKQKFLRSEKDPVTGMAFKTTAKCTNLFVATSTSVLQYNVSIKDKEEEVYLDSAGCEFRCSVLADSIQDSPFMVGRDDAIYCYTIDGRGPCYAVEGRKVFLQWFRGYLVIVAKKDAQILQSPVTVSSTNSEESKEADKNEYLITVLDIQNKFIVYSNVFQEVVSILPEWGSFYILTKDYRLHHVSEKDLQSKLSLLFKKNLYDISIRIAKSQQYDSESLVDIFREYADHLYAKGDHNAAIEQYIKTIGKLEPSYVIRKFLDSQHVDNLIKYLSALHKRGFATADHTTLLLNCYTKMNNIHKLKEFILTKDQDIDFDVNIAISVCRYPASDDALLLAEKYGLHVWYIKILLEDRQNYLSALQYIAKLNFSDAYEMISEFGITLIQNVPNETTNFLKKLCTNYKSSEMTLANQVDENSIDKADPQDFIHLFLNDSKRMVEFIEYLIQSSIKLNSSIYHTLLDHYLYIWSSSNDTTLRLQYEQKIMAILQSSNDQYNSNRALILCTTRNFSPGILYIFEENKSYHKILKYQLNCGNYQGILACCRRFGYQEPSLWVKALSIASSDSDFPIPILSEILTVVEKEHLLSPIQIVHMLSKSQSLSISHVRSYLASILRTESKLIDEDAAQITKYEQETSNMRKQVEKIQTSPMLFQGSRCSACNNQLELPSIHFLCQHSYHQHCYQSFAENENECPACLPNNQKIMGIIKSQEQSRNLHEVFHSQLERSEDGFSLIADFFGRSIFNETPYLSDTANRFAKAFLSQKKHASGNKNTDASELKTALSSSYKPGIKTQVQVDEEVSSTLEANITSTPIRRSPVNMKIEETLSSAIRPASSSKYKNPFDDDYDDSKNPFFDATNNDIDDDYDNTLNPFAS